MKQHVQYMLSANDGNGVSINFNILILSIYFIPLEKKLADPACTA